MPAQTSSKKPGDVFLPLTWILTWVLWMLPTCCGSQPRGRCCFQDLSTFASLFFSSPPCFILSPKTGQASTQPPPLREEAISSSARFAGEIQSFFPLTSVSISCKQCHIAPRPQGCRQPGNASKIPGKGLRTAQSRHCEAGGSQPGPFLQISGFGSWRRLSRARNSSRAAWESWGPGGARGGPSPTSCGEHQPSDGALCRVLRCRRRGEKQLMRHLCISVDSGLKNKRLSILCPFVWLRSRLLLPAFCPIAGARCSRGGRAGKVHFQNTFTSGPSADGFGRGCVLLLESVPGKAVSCSAVLFTAPGLACGGAAGTGGICPPWAAMLCLNPFPRGAHWAPGGVAYK